MTKKLFWQNSHLTSFTAQVVDSFLEGERHVLVLDQTAFYPTGGGQPCDLGTINSAQVCDVSMTSNGRIYHYLEAPLQVELGDEVKGEIDGARRLDLRQQHTGQHILSQAFFQLFGAETRGFRINANSSEIDLTLDSKAKELSQYLVEAEGLANEIVFSDRAIHSHLVSPQEAAALPLRKEIFVENDVRIIEIEGFDWSACGGTHANRTGEVGLIAVKHWERAKQMLRVTFLCGGRVIRDYRAANQLAERIAQQFNVARDESVNSVLRLVEENKNLKRLLRQTAELAAKYEAEKLLAITSSSQFPAIVVAVFDHRDLEELKILAHQLVSYDSVVALLAMREQDFARLVFARSKNVAVNVGELMREVCQEWNGRGGGTHDFAQGGITVDGQLETILNSLRDKLS